MTRGITTFVVGSIVGIAAGIMLAPAMGIDAHTGDKVLQSGRRLARRAGKTISNMM